MSDSHDDGERRTNRQHTDDDAATDGGRRTTGPVSAQGVFSRGGTPPEPSPTPGKRGRADGGRDADRNDERDDDTGNVSAQGVFSRGGR
jgi:hypothetical protein